MTYKIIVADNGYIVEREGSIAVYNAYISSATDTLPQDMMGFILEELIDAINDEEIYKYQVKVEVTKFKEL